MIAEAIRNRLISSAEIRSRLATYPFGATSGTTTPGGSSGEDAAVFTFAPPPTDAQGPLVTVVERGGKPWGCRGRRGTENAAIVEIWGDKSGRTDAALRSLAQDVFERLNRADLALDPSLAGYEEWGCAAEPPESLRDADGYPGYRIGVTVRLLEE